MSDEVVFRRAALADLDAVVALDAQVHGGAGYGPYVVRQYFDLAPATFWVATRAGAVIGYGLGAVGADGVGWVLSLATAAEARRGGVARGLAHAVLDALWRVGVRVVKLTVAPDNRGAQALYGRFGFIVMAAEADYYGPGGDRLVMELELDETGVQWDAMV